MPPGGRFWEWTWSGMRSIRPRSFSLTFAIWTGKCSGVLIWWWRLLPARSSAGTICHGPARRTRRYPISRSLRRATGSQKRLERRSVWRTSGGRSGSLAGLNGSGVPATSGETGCRFCDRQRPPETERSACLQRRECAGRRCRSSWRAGWVTITGEGGDDAGDLRGRNLDLGAPPDGGADERRAPTGEAADAAPHPLDGEPDAGRQPAAAPEPDAALQPEDEPEGGAGLAGDRGLRGVRSDHRGPQARLQEVLAGSEAEI